MLSPRSIKSVIKRRLPVLSLLATNFLSVFILVASSHSKQQRRAQGKVKDDLDRHQQHDACKYYLELVCLELPAEDRADLRPYGRAQKQQHRQYNINAVVGVGLQEGDLYTVK